MYRCSSWIRDAQYHCSSACFVMTWHHAPWFWAAGRARWECWGIRRVCTCDWFQAVAIRNWDLNEDALCVLHAARSVIHDAHDKEDMGGKGCAAANMTPKPPWSQLLLLLIIIIRIIIIMMIMIIIIMIMIMMIIIIMNILWCISTNISIDLGGLYPSWRRAASWGPDLQLRGRRRYVGNTCPCCV